jgi:patatin-like phospholipase/acyl hydrolase
MSIKEKMTRKGPKKLLALDGGGIRGLISIEVLAKIERLLREQSGKKDLVLADYFDYIAGTSTGAVIGTLLSLGKSVDEIRDIYLSMGKMMFGKSFILRRFKKIASVKRYSEMAANVAANLAAKPLRHVPGVKRKWLKIPYSEYPDTPMIEKLQDLVGGDDVTLGSPNLRTLLMLVLANASTDSPWPVSNNPCAKYNRRDREDCNLNIPLWQLVRASTAAPSVFPAQEIRVGRKEFVFIDGGVTPYNNPAFQLFAQATLKPYKLEWKTGEKEMLLISVGTGLNPKVDLALEGADMSVPRIAEIALAAQFNSAIYQQDFLCRAFGKCLIGGKLDNEVEMMVDTPAPGGDKLFTYARYNVELSKTSLLELGLKRIDPNNVAKLDSVEFMDELVKVGARLADRQVRAEHFAAFPV